MTQRTDPRYGTYRWRRLARAVLVRDRHVCRVVAGCAVRASAADHVIPVASDTPDSLFFDARNLRAACRDHNLARGHAAKLVAAPGPSAVVTSDYTRKTDAGAA